MMYLLAAVAASGIFIAAGWRSKHAHGLAAAHRGHRLPIDPLWDEPEIDVDASETRADIGTAIRLVLKRLAPVMASLSVQAEIASPFGVAVRMRSGLLADMLEELLTAAIHDAPGSRLLITATTHGGSIHVGITDDMPGADAAARQGSVRRLTERVAMRGGALDINVRPAEGTTMTLRLAAATERDEPLPEPAVMMAGSGAISVKAEL